MPRALLLVLDSVGCGAAPDAAQYGDVGADTLGHILQQVPTVHLPHLRQLGLGRILGLQDENVSTSYGRMRPASTGKDTTSGHCELAGAVLTQPFATFERFPDELVSKIEHAANVKFLGNVVASGTQVLERLGEQSVASGRPILYTCADSVLQIAAHEAHFGLEKLLHVCEVARRFADEWNIGRVIARPFLGEWNNWSRTANRRDYSILPPRTVLDALQGAGVNTIGIGKIGDIFAGRGLNYSLPTKSNIEGMETIAAQWDAMENGLLFANLVDFDTLYGHRRDVQGYADALEDFDVWLGDFLLKVRPDDLVIITADHGNDPTFHGTDHTREEVPLMVLNGRSEDLGTREGFADVAALVARYFGVEWVCGVSLD